MSFIKKLISGLSDESGKNPAQEAPETDERLNEYQQIFTLAKKRNLSPEKKAELESLYTQLLTKSDNVGSGQLQFLGLDKVKQKMGAEKWGRLQGKVYQTAEEVITSNVNLEHDIHFLYKEDRYVIIFTQSTVEEINEKVSFISQEILQRLLLLERESFSELEIKQEVKKLEAGSFLTNEFPDMLDYIFQQYNPASVKTSAKQALDLKYAYIPMWETGQKALTTYTCLAKENADQKNNFDVYKSLFQGKTLAEKTAIDVAVLGKVTKELHYMANDGREALSLICPVQHETLYNFETYDEYKKACLKIPASHRKSLIFLITNSETYSLPAKDPYWFIPLLKEYCHEVFVDIPMRDPMTFQMLQRADADGIGIRLQKILPTEQRNLALLSSFTSKAKSLKINKTFAFDVTTTSEIKFLKNAGFDYMGGFGISKTVNMPDLRLQGDDKELFL